jgi:hypothetical protein
VLCLHHLVVPSDFQLCHAGMPGLLGGLSAAVASYWAHQPNKLLIEHAHHQWAYQLLAIFVTLGATAASSLAGCLLHHCSGAVVQWLSDVIPPSLAVLAIGGGLLAGIVVAKTDPFKQSLGPELMYEDAPFWVEKGEEEE